jgi:hypothetical protein
MHFAAVRAELLLEELPGEVLKISPVRLRQDFRPPAPRRRALERSGLPLSHSSLLVSSKPTTNGEAALQGDQPVLDLLEALQTPEQQQPVRAAAAVEEESPS